MSTLPRPDILPRAFLLCDSVVGTEKGVIITDPIHKIDITSPTKAVTVEAAFSVFFAINKLSTKGPIDLRFTVICPDDTEGTLYHGTIGKEGEDNPWIIASTMIRLTEFGEYWVTAYLDDVLFAQASLTMMHHIGQLGSDGLPIIGRTSLDWPDDIG
jgi:hypothetical protein